VGGLALVASSFEWNANLTPRDLWLGGRRSEGDGSSDSGSDDRRGGGGGQEASDGKRDHQETSRQGLERVMLANGFELVQEEDMPVMSRLSARKWEVALSNVTVWRRVA